MSILPRNRLNLMREARPPVRKRKVTITVETHRRVVIRRIAGQETPVAAAGKTDGSRAAAVEGRLARKEKAHD